ncbi:MAG: phosphatase/phosphohexomutase [uncultured bacterium]|nr:MAG: phosphatase/phosphohexomutase [uncultured bacterium]
MQKFKAVIFDMDGVLIDSMLQWPVVLEPFFQKYNIVRTEEMVKYASGRSEQENLAWLKENFNLPGTIDELVAERQQYSGKIYSELTQPLPGVEELMKKIKQNLYLQAIGSGAPMKYVNKVVERFQWEKYFDELVSSEHVNFIGKPDPSIYLCAADKLKVAPADCLVFEDAENGLVAAKRAGMSCVAITDPRWSFGDFSQADLRVDNFFDERIHKLLF